jgi:tetratricopeptide (TPR) repeat protein
MWEKLSAEDPENVDLLTRLSRAYFLLADGFVRRASQNGQSLALYDKGIAAGERAMLAVSEEFAKRVRGGEPVESAIAAIPASGQAALFWYASNLGRFVSADLTTAAMYKDRIHVVMQRVLQLDPTFFYAAPHRYFGAFYARAPHFLGGNLEKSKEHFERALQIEPHCLETKVLYAEYYARKLKDKELFLRLLTEVIEADPQALPDLLPEQELAKQRARELLKNHERLFK